MKRLLSILFFGLILMLVITIPVYANDNDTSLSDSSNTSASETSDVDASNFDFKLTCDKDEAYSGDYVSCSVTANTNGSKFIGLEFTFDLERFEFVDGVVNKNFHGDIDNTKLTVYSDDPLAFEDEELVSFRVKAVNPGKGHIKLTDFLVVLNDTNGNDFSIADLTYDVVNKLKDYKLSYKLNLDDLTGVYNLELYENGELFDNKYEDDLILYAGTKVISTTNSNVFVISSANAAYLSRHLSIKIADETYIIYKYEYINIKPDFTVTRITAANSAPALKVTIPQNDNVILYKVYDNGALVKSTTSLEVNLTNLKYGSHDVMVEAYGCANGNIDSCTLESVDSITDSKTVNYTITPTSSIFTLTRNGRYDQNKLVINKPTNVNKIYNKINFYIYRSSDGKNYYLVKTISSPSTTANTTYIDTISGASLGKYYYYKVFTNIDGVNSSAVTRSIKSTLVTPTTYVGNATNGSQIAYTTNQGSGVKYQIYMATSKTGKYTKIYDGSGTSVTKSTTYNKTYYYKIRAYLGKTYTSYSSITAKKDVMEAIDKYPLTKKSGTTTDTIKSFTVTRKSSGSTSKFTFKLNHKKTVAKSKVTLSYKIKFYNYNKTKNTTKTIKVVIPKGTKSNYSASFTISVPNWAVYYDVL